jgi:AraC-like DNA-binding protein
MGFSTHTLDQLAKPFSHADEMILYLPKGGQIEVTKELSKFIFVLDGEIEHEINRLSPRRVFRTGDILVSLFGNRYTMFNPDKRNVRKLHLFRLYLDNASLIRSHRKRHPQPEHDLGDFLCQAFARPVQMENAIGDHIIECINKLRHEAEKHSSGYRHRAYATCVELIADIAQRLPEPQAINQPTSSRSSSSPIVAGAKEYILKNLETKLTLADIAWKAGKGEEHLTRLFKRETGQSVFDYVREMRINRAKTYLFDSALTLTQIAGLCGFASLSYFTQTFRQLTGITPSSYRKHLDSSVIPGPTKRTEGH